MDYTKILRRAYRRGERVIVVTRISVYDGYVMGYRGKSIVIGALNSYYGFDPIGAISHNALQYIGPSSSAYGTPCGSARYSQSARTID